jgi:hypothetical protein
MISPEDSPSLGGARAQDTESRIKEPSPLDARAFPGIYVADTARIQEENERDRAWRESNHAAFMRINGLPQFNEPPLSEHSRTGIARVLGYETPEALIEAQRQRREAETLNNRVDEVAKAPGFKDLFFNPAGVCLLILASPLAGMLAGCLRYYVF